MFAAFYNESGDYIGYKPIDYAGEENTFQLPYRLYAELPEVLVNPPAKGFKVKFNKNANAFELEALPTPPAPAVNPLEQRIADLEMALADLMMGGSI